MNQGLRCGVLYDTAQPDEGEDVEEQAALRGEPKHRIGDEGVEHHLCCDVGRLSQRLWGVGVRARQECC